MEVWILIITFASLDPGNGLKRGFYINEHVPIEVATEKACLDLGNRIAASYHTVHTVRCFKTVKAK